MGLLPFGWFIPNLPMFCYLFVEAKRESLLLCFVEGFLLLGEQSFLCLYGFRFSARRGGFPLLWVSILLFPIMPCLSVESPPALLQVLVLVVVLLVLDLGRGKPHCVQAQWPGPNCWLREPMPVRFFRPWPSD